MDGWATSLIDGGDKELIPMKKIIFSKVLEARNAALHRRAVLQEIVEHLRKFLDTDTTPAKLGITTDGGGLVVPQSVVEAMILELESGPISDVEAALGRIDQSEVAENVRQESEDGAKEGTKGRKGRSKGTAARQK